MLLFPVSPLWRMLTLMAQIKPLSWTHETSSGALYLVSLIFLGMVSHTPIKKKTACKRLIEGSVVVNKASSNCTSKKVIKWSTRTCTRLRDFLHMLNRWIGSCLSVPPSPPCLSFQACTSALGFLGMLLWARTFEPAQVICGRNEPILHLLMPQSRGLVSPAADSHSSWPPISFFYWSPPPFPLSPRAYSFVSELV